VSQTSRTSGLSAGLTAHLLWGVFPLYFKLLDQAGALEIVAHRIWWACVVCALCLTVRRAWRDVAAVWRRPRLALRLALAGALISLNWLLYVWAVVNDQVVDAALGYFINPLVTVALAIVVLRERLRRAQWLALGCGAVAVAVIVIGYGQFPWVGLGLAVTFSLYSLAKNRVGHQTTPLVGLGFETAAVTPLALAGLIWFQASGQSHFVGHGTWYTVGLIGTGVITAGPLILFAIGAARLPLSTLALLQYVTPLMQFSIGVWLFHEQMPLARWVGFALIWVALGILSFDGLRAARRRRTGDRPEPEERPEPKDRSEPDDQTGTENRPAAGIEPTGPE
jgi:chloramphenicol-sensitive protein RarD